MGPLEEPVEDGVGQGGVGHGAVPGLDGKLAGDHGGAELATILDDLEEIAGLLDADGREQEVVELLRHRSNST